MLEYLKAKAASLNDDLLKQNLVRELLQVQILKFFDKAKAFDSMAFVGGTALRIIYDLDRFSEDLDFSLIDNEANLDFESLIEYTVNQLQLQGLSVSHKKIKTKTAVYSTFIEFPSLLFNLGLSPLKSAKLRIKIELDTNPLGAYKLERKIINRAGEIVGLQSFKLDSLFAGKLHAVLERSYTKGRD